MISFEADNSKLDDESEEISTEANNSYTYGIMKNNLK